MENLLPVVVINREVIMLLRKHFLGSGLPNNGIEQVQIEFNCSVAERMLSLNAFSEKFLIGPVEKVAKKFRGRKIVPFWWEIPPDLIGAVDKFDGVSARTLLVPTPEGTFCRIDIMLEGKG